MFKRGLLSRREALSARMLKANEQLSADELAALNWQRRKEIVQFAYNNNSFYQKKYATAGFEPGDLKSPDDFERLPVLEKQEIRENIETMVSWGYDIHTLPASTTGGSTGIPLKTYCDPSAPGSEISWRTLNWWGTDISDNSAYLYRAIPSPKSQLLQRIFLWPSKRSWLAAQEMGVERMERFYRELLKIRPRYLVGYVGAIDIFADFLEHQHYKLDSIKAVWTTSAPLPEGKRAYLQGIFNAPVLTQYGSCEFYWIGAECLKQNGMHVASDIRHVEVVDGQAPVAPEEFGDLLVTDLCNHAFPLIRYRLGDRGRLLNKPCSCGLPFGLMDYVKGRISDTIYLPDGGAIPGEYWTTIFDDYTGCIKSFQVHQSSDYSITIFYEALRQESCVEAIDAVRTQLEKKLGPKVTLVFESKHIDVNDNGKTRFVVSEIRS
jgi:phenylacetate-CoA ligase